MLGNRVLKGDCKAKCHPSTVNDSFVNTQKHHFMLNGKPLVFNGFNAYWLMCMASDPSTRAKVTAAFQESSKIGMNLVRTWAFSDGGNKPLQTSPGIYNEDMFKGLDFVISEAQKYGFRLILSLVNNWDDFGGKKQYVQWARDRGQYVNSDDEFFTNLVVKGYYKNHLKMIPIQSGASDEARAKFVENWIASHIGDCDSILKKPLLIAEFGKSSWSSGYTVEARDECFRGIFDMAYESARNRGSCSGTTFWQVMAVGMDNWGDGYQVVLDTNPSTAAVIAKQSQRISSLSSSLEL